MKRLALVVVLGLILSTNSFAEEIITVEVNGMVCDFCARALEMTFNKQESVSSIDIDLTAKVLIISLKDGASLDDQAIESLVTNAGYSVGKINRN